MTDLAEIFDPNKLQSSDFRDYFDRIQLRMDEISRSIVAGYGLPAHIHSIRAFIARELKFNAQASLSDQTAYISINASVLLSLRILFDRVLSDDEVLPRLNDTDLSSSVSYETEFILNTNTPQDWSRLSISLGKDKYKASGILSDLCVTFVALHEFGHLLCGHVEAVEKLYSEASLMEFYRISERTALDPELRQYWEFQADSIAASFLAQYIGDLIAKAGSYQTWILTAAKLQADQREDIAIHTAAMTIASLHVLFLYMDSCTFDTNKNAYHPPAQCRVMYIKDIIATNVGRRCSIEPDAIVSMYYDEYFSSFVSSLDKLGLPALRGFNDEHLDTVNDIVHALKYSNDRHRDFCREWSWLPVDEWGNPQRT